MIKDFSIDGPDWRAASCFPMWISARWFAQSHPLWVMRGRANALREALYKAVGRLATSPERLLCAALLRMLYPAGSERR